MIDCFFLEDGTGRGWAMWGMGPEAEVYGENYVQLCVACGGRGYSVVMPLQKRPLFIHRECVQNPRSVAKMVGQRGIEPTVFARRN